MLGLDQEVERGKAAVDAVIGEDDRFRRTAGRPVLMIDDSTLLAATTHGLPGPTILSAGFTVSVP